MFRASLELFRASWWRRKRKVKKAGLECNTQKMKIMSFGTITSWPIDGGKVETVTGIIFLGSKIIADSDCSHEIKRHLLLRREAMTNLGSILKSRDNTLPTKVCIAKALVFPVVMYGCKSWIIKKLEPWRTDAFKLWFWRKLFRVLWTAGRKNKNKNKNKNSESQRKSTLNIHWKEWCWNWSSNTLTTWCKESTHWQRPWCWERWRVRGEGGDRGWDAWMASPTQWIWVWANSGRQWRIGKACVLQFFRSQIVGHNLATPFLVIIKCWFGFLDGSVVKNQPANAGDVDLIPGLRWSPGKEKGNPVLYPCLGNLMDRGTCGLKSVGS